MRKLLFVLLCLLITLPVAALRVQAVAHHGAIEMVNKGDTLLFFNGAPDVRTSDGKNADWYRYPEMTILQTNIDEIYPESGIGIMCISADKADTSVFWVFDYNDYRIVTDTLWAELYCEQTLLHLEGTVPAIKYTAMGGQRTVERKGVAYFHSLRWANGWRDTIVLDTVALTTAQGMVISKSLSHTDFTLRYDLIAEQLNLQDSIISDVYAPIAIEVHPTAAITTRGIAGELSNEVQRPTDSEGTTDSPISASGPLDIRFTANATPAVIFYNWKIRHASELLVERTDMEQRYDFVGKGGYMVTFEVSNDICSAMDSFSINISESQLLVPNVFTPNGDGKNDEFRVLYKSLAEFHCWVYNRWGRLVYEWTDPAKGWDGTIGGRPAAEGAYFYVIRARGTDADPTKGYSSKISYNKAKRQSDQSIIGIYQLSGSINLLRGKKQ